jgi:hypothetical protein
MSMRVTTEQVPCGIATTTEHVDEAGEVVRRDVRVDVERMTACETGVRAAAKRIWNAGVEAGRKAWNEQSE